MSSSPSDVLRFGTFELHLGEGDLRRDGHLVKLQPQPFRVLSLLARRAGSVVSREELKQEVWGSDGTHVDFERGLNFCVLQIRSALGDDADNPRFVQTLPRRGYRFIAPVATPSATPLPLPLPSRRAVGPWLALSSAAVLVATGLGAVMVRSARPAPPARAMLAVLPFENLGSDDALRYFSDGLSEELITRLGRLAPDGLGVIAPTSSQRSAAGRGDVARIASTLGVDYVLTGSVRRDPERMRVAVQLVRARDLTQVFAESFDQASGAGIAVQEEIARRVASSLALRLLPSPASAPANVSFAAYDAYLKGRYLVNRGAREDLARAAAQLDTAIALAPSFAAAHAAQADLWHLRRVRDELPPGVAYPKARDAAKAALALAPDLPEAHRALAAALLWYDWNPEAAAASLETALAANPSLALAHHDLAWARIAQGRAADAVAEILRARELDPLSPRTNCDVGWVYLQARRYEEALMQCQRTLELEPGYPDAESCLLEAYLHTGRAREANALTLARLRRGGATPEQLELLQRSEPEAALVAARRARLARLLEQTAAGNDRHLATAAAQAALGDKDAALRSLEQAFAARSPELVLLATNPAFDALRADTRFDAFAQRVRAAAR